MAIVRCAEHNVRIDQATNRYVRRAEPIGYPDTAAICGRRDCEQPGLVWLTDEDLQAFNAGSRYVTLETNTVKLRVSDRLLPLP